jgi:phage host-nuclease inhibitor protein Gam
MTEGSKGTRRVKKTVEPTLRSREQAEACVAQIAALTLDLDDLRLRMDARIKSVRDEYQDSIADCEAELEAELRLVEEWARANAAEFAARKSLEFVHGVIGFRIGNPTLRTVKGATWAFVLERLAELRLFSYVRTKTEPDKEKLLADREKLGPDRLGEIGVRVEQAETFFVEPRREPAAAAVAAG